MAQPLSRGTAQAVGWHVSDQPPAPRSLQDDHDSWTYTLDAKASHSGAQGVVHYGLRSDGVEVAVKIAGESSSQEQSLHHEIGMLKALGAAQVQGVVDCLDVIDVGGRVGMVMPRYPRHMGVWLRQTIDGPTADTLDDILSRVATVARILANVHRVPWAGQTVIHRDVKPENIFEDKRGRVVLGDFGGAMAISGLKAVELALFGSPMYAPLDQILPGIAIPDTTWDTYGLCVILYAAITGSRPAYQADPRSLLTSTGRELWELASRAIDAKGREAQRLRVAFAQARIGTSAADLVDVTGHSSLNVHDRELLDGCMATLCERAGVPESRIRLVQQGMWSLLARGLSPVSHPSPPNRFRGAEELAEQLEDLRDLLSPEPLTRTPSTPVKIEPQPQVPPARRSWMNPWPLIALSGGLLIAGTTVVLMRYPLDSLLGIDRVARIPPATVSLTHHRPPATAQQLVGHTAQVHHDKFRYSGEPVKLTADLDSACASTIFTVRSPSGEVVLQRDVGTQPAGLVREPWQPPADLPHDIYTVQISATLGDKVIDATVIVESAATSVRDGLPVYSGTPVTMHKVLAWSSQTEVDAFQIDTTEVRSESWTECVQHGVCTPHPTASNHPVVGVTFEEAAAYCTYRGGALPTEAQWLSAHGPERYPWGQQVPSCERVHGAGCSEQPSAVGMLPKGASRDGVLDLAGNAWEWVAEGEGGTVGVLVGGSVQSKGGAIGRGSRVDPASDHTPAWAGLRCAYADKAN
ncbi:MAG: serine/threonine protein kinase [Kiritimatiellia bacterium]|jgi:serine/threonine protein kinase